RRDTTRADVGMQEQEAILRERQLAREREELEYRRPFLAGEDTVIINVSVRTAQPVQPQQGQITAGQVTAGQPQGPGVQDSTQGLTVRRPIQPPIQLTEEERRRLEQLVNLISSRNPYRLTREGVLELPGFKGIPLAGLNEFEATVRLQAEPALRGLDVSLIRVPLRQTGFEALKPFGYDLFDHAPS